MVADVSCPGCGNSVGLTPQRRLIAAHGDPSGMRCSFSGKRPPFERAIAKGLPCPVCDSRVETDGRGKLLSHWAKDGRCSGGGKRPVGIADENQPLSAQSAPLGVRIAFGIAAAGLLVLIILGAASGDSDSANGSPVASDSGSSDSGSSDSPSDSNSSSSKDDVLADAGVTAQMLSELQQVRIQTGYASLSQASTEENEEFAVGLLFMCRDTRAGQSTWDEWTQQDISTGAPPADARRFNDYLRTNFCSNVR